MPETRVPRRLLLALLLAATALVYRPGLHGGFLFDDYVNLDALGAEPPLASFAALLRYLTSGLADPTGRPVALLSFLLDAHAWPAQPAPFLRTNLLIHLLNGLLLVALLRRLGESLGWSPARSGSASLLGGGLWLLHPLLVSTTLYVVQRQSMLAASFVLLGSLGWLLGRERMLRGERGAGAWMLAAIVLGTALAGLSKANGFLLPLLALVLEWVIDGTRPLDRDSAAARRLRRWRVGLLLLPSALLLLALAALALDASAYAGRDFNLVQRLWSEGRVVADYLRLLYVPRVMSDGLFNDDVRVSLSWRYPATTLPAALLLAGMLGAGIASRRRAPAWSAGLLFFLAGHLVESTVLPLELRFEHRNYLPALLLFWPLADLVLSPSWGTRRIRLAVAGLLLAFLGLLTWQRSQLWGHPDQLAASWLAKHPRSPRSLAYRAISLRDGGHAADAAKLLDAAWAQAPTEAQLALGAIDAHCAAGDLRVAHLRRLENTLAHGPGDLLPLRWLDAAIDPDAPCRLPSASLREVLGAVEANPAYGTARLRQNIDNLRGRLALRAGDPAAAQRWFRASLREDPRPEVAAAQASMLLEAGYHRQAMAYLDFYSAIAAEAAPLPFGMPRVHAWLLRRQHYWDRVFGALRAAAREGLAGS